MDFRIERFKRLYDTSKEKSLEQALIKADKKRSNYYGYYTGNDWDNINNYDLVINTAKFGIEKSIEYIIDGLEQI